MTGGQQIKSLCIVVQCFPFIKLPLLKQRSGSGFQILLPNVTKSVRAEEKSEARPDMVELFKAE